MQVRVREKQQIATAAAQLLQPAEAIIIGSGTTCGLLPKPYPRHLPLTVLTSAMNVTLSLIDHPQVEIVQLGGVVRKSSRSVVGHYSEAMLADFACSKLFLSVDGVSPDFGLTTSNMMEAHLNAQMVKAVPQVMLLADASKFGKKGFGRIGGLEEVHTIITDEGLSDSYRRQIEELGIKLGRFSICPQI